MTINHGGHGAHGEISGTHLTQRHTREGYTELPYSAGLLAVDSHTPHCVQWVQASAAFSAGFGNTALRHPLAGSVDASVLRE